MLHTTKLLTLFTLSLCCFSCKSEKRTSQKQVPTEEVGQIKLSPLEEQISLMLQDKPADESILRREIESQGWESAHRTFLDTVEKHDKIHGQKPEKIIMGRSLMRLSRINGQIELALSKERRKQAAKAKKESLERLEKSIQEAIEKEKGELH